MLVLSIGGHTKNSQKVNSNIPVGKGIIRKYLNIAQTINETTTELVTRFKRPFWPINIMRTKRKTPVDIAKPITCMRKRYPMQMAMAISIRAKPLR